ncbi:hypothetical protein BV210_17335 [Halorientalis sp. IM1011]|uniref:hypothetical protein n=1 Tax=Halorientalis sp. IM1011 TaxID=1932360 RepID=UPI00097CCDF9|nr:hypothetical protein [Halorientalis sp. IM1011]AQL44370.1 hypothetical protein BV210_17335 [Halorientalis sp. IM1011]
MSLDRTAAEQLSSQTERHVVAGAGHLFEGDGERDEVATVAADLFAECLWSTDTLVLANLKVQEPHVLTGT